eukprot:CAMPEP_0178378170 /NCGR_PEP_ID=MMETSP0689_2-20121128/4291_1 /TAXON_ID=160604 /ORGANISM="Amphidinium massartii, Strain CS-259" /LENGTH=87 /DNA_ID=CAMNT_0019998237 /DNA_START=276 /DNA_END=539 /DNA_ORIENTATION=-
MPGLLNAGIDFPEDLIGFHLHTEIALQHLLAPLCGWEVQDLQAQWCDLHSQVLCAPICRNLHLDIDFLRVLPPAVLLSSERRAQGAR